MKHSKIISNSYKWGRNNVFIYAYTNNTHFVMFWWDTIIEIIIKGALDIKIASKNYNQYFKNCIYLQTNFTLRQRYWDSRKSNAQKFKINYTSIETIGLLLLEIIKHL